MEMTATIKFTYTNQDIDDIVCAALEGGINYWCDEAKVEGEYLGEYASDQISRGGRLILHLMEPEDDDKDTVILDRDNLLAGIRKYVECPSSPYDILLEGNEGWELNTCQVDGMVADQIVQYAVFGKQVYA